MNGNKKVIIWDLDETLITFQGLLSPGAPGKYNLSHHDGKKFQSLIIELSQSILRICDQKLFFQTLMPFYPQNINSYNSRAHQTDNSDHMLALSSLCNEIKRMYEEDPSVLVNEEIKGEDKENVVNCSDYNDIFLERSLFTPVKKIIKKKYEYTSDTDTIQRRQSDPSYVNQGSAVSKSSWLPVMTPYKHLTPPSHRQESPSVLPSPLAYSFGSQNVPDSILSPISVIGEREGQAVSGLLKGELSSSQEVQLKLRKELERTDGVDAPKKGELENGARENSSSSAKRCRESFESPSVQSRRDRNLQAPPFAQSLLSTPGRNAPSLPCTPYGPNHLKESAMNSILSAQSGRRRIAFAPLPFANSPLPGLDEDLSSEEESAFSKIRGSCSSKLISPNREENDSESIPIRKDARRRTRRVSNLGTPSLPTIDWGVEYEKDRDVSKEESYGEKNDELTSQRLWIRAQLKTENECSNPPNITGDTSTAQTPGKEKQGTKETLANTLRVKTSSSFSIAEAKSLSVKREEDNQDELEKFSLQKGLEKLSEMSTKTINRNVAIVEIINDIAHNWIYKTRSVMRELTQCEDVVHYIVTAGHLIPSLVKLCVFGLNDFFPAQKIFSSSKLGKLQCFQDILQRETAVDKKEVFVVGDGEEEMYASSMLGLHFLKIESAKDLLRVPGFIQ